MSQNIYSNEYYMNIDWQLMCAKYQDRDQETKNKVTVHLATGKDEKAVDYDSFKDGQLPSDNYQFTKYSFMATPSYQKQKMIEAYFDQTKELDQKITFSWDKDMLGIEYFLPSDAKNVNFEVPTDQYKVPMARNNLSLIGLQLNGTNLFDLLNKKTNLQDCRSAIKANNDNNLKIEEKFVKYCDISSIANVSFFDNTVSKNSIQNDFTTCFINTDSKCKVETKSNINNIGPSKNFSNNAIKFYKQVVNYVDTGKIEKEVEEWHEFSQLIEAELYILTAFCAMLFICIVIRWFYYSYHWKWQYHDPNQPQPQVYVVGGAKFLVFFILFFFVVIFTVSLWLAWKYAVTIPISEEAAKVEKWNETIKKRSKSSSDNKINVIDKVNGDDKENFESVENFMSHYKKQSNIAFGSYFYYFHFVELSQKQTDNDQSTILDKDKNKIVKEDYKQFNDTKDECGISDRKLGRIIIAIISLVIIVFAIFLIYVNIVLTRLLASDWRTYLDGLNNAGAHAVGNLAHVGGGVDPNMIPAGPMNPVAPNMNPVIPQLGQQNNANDVDAVVIANIIEEFNYANNMNKKQWY